MEHVIYQSIMQHLEDKNILNSNQHGFRKNHSCETQLVSTIKDLVKGLDNGSEIDLQMFDLERPLTRYPTRYYFPNCTTMEFRVRHSLGSIHGLQRDFSVQSWMVKLLVTSDVPQGTVLGPLMFLLFINDIHENINSSLRLFADYALLYRSIDTTNNCAIRQNGINKLVSQSKIW